MKSNELRINNYVLVNGEPYKIDALEIYEEEIVDPLHPEPIPLTTEWLERCGFRHRNESEGVDRYFIGTNPVTNDWLFDIVKIDHYNYFFYRNGHFKIYHLHQLQNLYHALTGEELKITLP